jgi:hypothetical protein
VYTPELQDPLDLVGDDRRLLAPIQAPQHLNATTPRGANFPRLITLDCRRVASYLLETDPGLDDPAFEHSVTQSFAESVLAQSHDHELANDERDYSGNAIGGWIISTDSARVLAQRLSNYAIHQGALVRWTNPSVLSTLWPTMTPEQRSALLGGATWLAFDENGKLKRFAAGARDEGAGPIGAAGPRLDGRQLRMLKNVPLVRDLHARWKEMAEEQRRALPDDAQQRLHAHVDRAQRAGLDADSVAMYVMVAVQLKAGAVDDPEWTDLVGRAGREGLALRDLLDTLSDPFWERYGEPAPANIESTSNQTAGRVAATR